MLSSKSIVGGLVQFLMCGRHMNRWTERYVENWFKYLTLQIFFLADLGNLLYFPKGVHIHSFVVYLTMLSGTQCM